MNRLLREKICPKCHKMTLDYNDRGFRYRCLATDCLWEGNEAENESVRSDRLLSEQEICNLSTDSLCTHCTLHGTGKPKDIPCPIFDNTFTAISAQLTKIDKEWAQDIEEAWNEYVIYPITINPEKSAGRTQVIFNEKPGFPEFLKRWQERKKGIGL